jgi:hypothetical protein
MFCQDENSHDCSLMQDDSRNLAMALFPDLEPQLKRKKDHGMGNSLSYA